jgi:hypothetical protein
MQHDNVAACFLSQAVSDKAQGAREALPLQLSYMYGQQPSLHPNQQGPSTAVRHHQSTWPPDNKLTINT